MGSPPLRPRSRRRVGRVRGRPGRCRRLLGVEGVACLALTCGCSQSAKSKLRNAGHVQGTILASDARKVYVEQGGKRRYVYREQVTDVRQPGTSEVSVGLASVAFWGGVASQGHGGRQLDILSGLRLLPDA